MNIEERKILGSIHEKIIFIEKGFDKTPYPALVERVKIHGKFIWVAVGASIFATLKSFLGGQP